MNSLSSHVLDTTLGKPAAGMKIELTLPNGKQVNAQTNEDGRVTDWGDVSFTEGQYCIRFFCKEYLEQHHSESFYPFVDIHFIMGEKGGHYHVPLLVSPYSFSSYRGS